MRRAATTWLTAVALALAAAGAGQAATTSVRDQGHLRFVSADATRIVDEGPLSGTLPARTRVDFAYDGSPTVRASFTIHARGGLIRGRATCRLHNPTSFTPSFRGALKITGGSGRYVHARGSGELFGVFHRHGYALDIQAIGRLTY